MAYKKPGVTVTQEFVGLVPALAAFALPSVAVGAAYQLVDNDSLGNYAGTQIALGYASLMGGAVIDLEAADPDELFPVTKKPLTVKLLNAEVEILPQNSGSVVGDVLTDATPNQYDNVAAGDIVVVEETLNVSLIVGQTNGQTVDTAGLRDRLTTPTAELFANVKVGDTVTVTGGTNTTTGTYTVLVKLSNTVLKLDSDINDGGGASSDVVYSVTGDRGTANAGEYVIKSKTNANTLVLLNPMAENEAPLTYYIKRQLAEIELSRVDTLLESGFVASAAAVTLPVNAVLVHEINAVPFPVLSGEVVASYRALRNDLAANVTEVTSVTDITAAFGANQVSPANPLAYALSLMLQNTVTAVNGLGLDENAVTDEVLSYTSAADVLKLTDMYAIALLTQNPVVHTLFKNHVEQMSLPDAKLERVVLFNSKLIDRSVLQEGSTTSTATAGARVVVNTQVDGEADFANPALLDDATVDQFANVEPGDSVVVQSGTNIIPGTYTVLTVNSVNQLELSGNIISGGTASNVQYYIVRRDGLSADGVTFYDRNAAFLSNGVAAGHYITVLAGGLAGRYKIATVDSNYQVTLTAQVPGVASLETAIEYQADRNLGKTEQANLVKGYSASFASRRCVHVWPDVLKAPIGQTIEDLPGVYGPVVIAALTTGLPTHQGFTNLAVSGFLGLDHSGKGYFDDDQLNIIADGGTMILAQDGPQQSLYVRHQLTTDRSAIKFQEFSITKNVDFIAKFLRNSYTRFIGQYNITDTTLDELKTTGQAAVDFLTNRTRLPRIGGVIRGGSLTQIKESETAIDTVELRFGVNIPVPLNNIEITVQV